MLMRLGAFALRVGQRRAVDERTRAEMRGVNGTMNLEFSGPDGGGWHIVFADGRLAMRPGLVDSARATVKLKPEDYLALIAGDLSYSVARMIGKIRISGDGNFGILFGAAMENVRAAQTVKGLRGAVARAVVGRALRKGKYVRSRGA